MDTVEVESPCTNNTSMLTFTLGAIHQHEAFITLAEVTSRRVNTDLTAATIVVFTFILAAGAISGLILGIATIIIAITDQWHGYTMATTVIFLGFITGWGWKENFIKYKCNQMCYWYNLIINHICILIPNLEPLYLPEKKKKKHL